MSTFPLKFSPTGSIAPATTAGALIASPTCADSATFALQVLDGSMEPEFAQGCIIVIDPSARVTEGAFVLARVDEARDEARDESGDEASDEDAEYVLRRTMRVSDSSLSLMSLQAGFDHSEVIVKRQALLGVVVQRAGARRSYTKHYRQA